MLRSLILHIALLLNFNVFCQTLDFNNYTTSEGLITDEIYNLHQDKKGYIWVFSKYGTVKYNGHEFKTVLKNLPFEDSFIYAVYENSKGEMWIANSNAKIYAVRNDSALIINGIDDISTSLKNSVSEILKLYVDDSLSIYVNTKAHSYKLIKKTKCSYSYVELCKGFDHDCAIVKTVRYGDELFPIRTHYEFDKLYEFCDSKSVYVELPDRRKIKLHTVYLKSAVRNMKKYDQAIYFTLLNYLYKIKDENAEASKIPVGQSVILNYLKDQNNHVWVGCLNDGLYEIDENDSIVNHYFLNTTVNDLLTDHQNNLWISTSGRGLFKCQRFANTIYFSEASGLGTPISFIKKIDEELVVANTEGAIFSIKKNKIVTIRKEDSNQPLDILKEKGEFLVTLRFSLEKLNAKTKTIRKLSTIRHPTFTQGILKNEDTLIFVWRKGINFVVRNINKKKIDFDRKILSCALFENELWLGTQTGVYLYKSTFSKDGQILHGYLSLDKDTLLDPLFLHATRKSEIVKIIKDNSGIIWLCSQGAGLYKCEKGKLVNYSLQQGLPSNIVNSINFSENNALLSTNKGLFISRYNLKNGKYDHWENIYDGEIQNAVFFEKEIYIACKKGLVVLKDWTKTKSEKKLLFNLAYVKDDGVEYPSFEFKEVQNNSHKLEFKFDAITFGTKIPELFYRLEGPTTESGVNINTVIKFNSLRPGDYTLSVFPLVEGGRRLTIKTSFVVKPIFFQTVLFKISLSLFIIAVLISAGFILVRYRRKKEEQKLKNEQLLLEYKLVALKAQINPHFMSNCLSAIQDLILTDNTEKATFYVARFGLLVRQILEFSSQPLITLREELDLLKLYIELEQLRFKNKFIFSFDVERGIAANQTYVPPLILNPIVENAIWHGLLPLGNLRSGELNIQVSVNKRKLVFLIMDNGVGRTAQSSPIGNNKNKSYGIKITQQRLKNINYLVKHEDAKIEYEDVKDSKDNICGTRAFIFLPLNLNPYEIE